jgi:DNA-binding transcriptional ArsR family regulator
MKCNSYDNFFSNFANKTKFRMIMLLKDRPMSVNDLAKAMDEEQSKISHNLTKLSQCNILTAKQDGKKRIYSLNKDTIMPIMKMVEKHVEKHCDKRCKEC